MASIRHEDEIRRDPLKSSVPIVSSVQALDLGHHLPVHVLELGGVVGRHLLATLLRIRQNEHARRGPLGLPRRAQLLLAVHVDVRHAGLLAQDGDVRDHVDRGDVARDDAKAARVKGWKRMEG